VRNIELARNAFVEQAFAANNESDHARRVAATDRAVKLIRQRGLARV